MNGILIIDKPAGWTSHDVVARVRRILGERRVGHTGTLDPLATGVLVVLVGRATRLAQFLSGAEKEYEAVIRFGYATDTGDSTGTPRPVSAGGRQDISHVAGTTPTPGPAVVPIKEDLTGWSDQEIETALQSLRGEIEQVPPMYSAKKVKGRRLYELARRGEEIERKAVRVTVREFAPVRRSGVLLQRNTDGTCDVATRVVCSAGTYIRTLAESVGERLGVPAHLAELRRTRAGDFRIEDAISLEELSRMAGTQALAGILLPPHAALSKLPFVHLTKGDAQRARHGAVVSISGPYGAEWPDGQLVRMGDEGGNVIAVGVYDAGTRALRPRVCLAPEK